MTTDEFWRKSAELRALLDRVDLALLERTWRAETERSAANPVVCTRGRGGRR